jgi:hypothetical protein
MRHMKDVEYTLFHFETFFLMWMNVPWRARGPRLQHDFKLYEAAAGLFLSDKKSLNTAAHCGEIHSSIAG